MLESVSFSVSPTTMPQWKNTKSPGKKKKKKLTATCFVSAQKHEKEITSFSSSHSVGYWT